MTTLKWDLITSEPTNNTEGSETNAKPLSPIDEVDETSFTDSELLENQCEPTITMSFEEAEQLSCQPFTNLDQKRSIVSENGRGDSKDRQCFVQLPETPPEVLRKRLNSSQDYSKYLEAEYEELFEFTQLERQIEHEDCVSKETEKLLKDELEMLNNKVKYLIQDNEYLQNKNISKEIQITELKSSLSSCQEIQSLMKQTINNIGAKLNPVLKGSMEDVLEDNPSLHSLLVDSIDSRNDHFSVEDIHTLIDLLLKSYIKLRTKTGELSIENEELKSKNEVFTNKMKYIEKYLITLEQENTRLEHKLLIEVSNKADLLNSLNLKHNQFKEAESLLRTSSLKNSKLEKELRNVVKVNDIQVEFQSVIQELDSLLNSWDTKNDLSDFVDNLLANKQLNTCVNIVMDHDSQTNLVSLLKKLREKLKLYDKERSGLNKTVLELKNHIPLLQNETSEIKSSVIGLNSVIQDVVNIQIKELEVKLNVVTTEKQNSQSKVSEMNNEIIYLSDSVGNIKSQLEEKNKMVNVESFDNSNSEDDSTLNCSNLFNFQSETTDSNYFKEKVEELDKLKEMMVNEITCLDSRENKGSIVSLSSNDLFARLMQNIIKKEEELSASIEKQLKVDLQKAEEKAESSRNKRKSQESWISLLQSENEAMSKELTCMKDKSTSLERELKNCYINLNSANSEISTLKSKLLELTTDNDVLAVNNDKLLNLLQNEKQSVSSLQQSLKKLKEDLTVKEYFVEDFKSNKNIIESTEKQYFNLKGGSVDTGNLLVDNKYEDFLNFQSPTLITCSNDGRTSACDKFIFGNDKFKQIDVLSKSHWAANAFGKSFENEKILLVDLLVHSETNELLGEHLLSCSANFVIIKDILQTFANKIIEIERTKSKKLLLMETEFSNITELCNDINSDITKLYEDVISDNTTQENDTSYSQFSQYVSGYPCNKLSVKEELELVKEECFQIPNHARKVIKPAKNGKCVIEMLREEVNKIKHGSLLKDVVIEDLGNAVSVKQSEVKELEKEIKSYLSKMSTAAEEKSYLENEIKHVTDQISSFFNIFSECDRIVHIAPSNISNSIECLRRELEQSVENKSLVADLKETVQFFTSQCSFLACYVKELENEHFSVQKKNANLDKEVDILKKQMIITNNHIDEADRFLNRLTTNIPYKVSSSHQAVEAAEQIFSEFKTLKEKERVTLDEQRTNLQILSDCQQNISSLEKYNSDLQLQLGSYESEIRILRTELRNLRSHWRRKERTRVITNEQECQTERLCCRELQGQVSNLKKLSDAEMLKTTSIELHMIEETVLYKKKVSELENALLHAKERWRILGKKLDGAQDEEAWQSLHSSFDGVELFLTHKSPKMLFKWIQDESSVELIRDLRFELTESKNMTREIIESYKEKYQEQKDWSS